MRKFLIIKPCHDKYTGQKYTVGEVIEVSNARGKELAKCPHVLTEVFEDPEEPDQRTRGRKKKEA